MLGDVVEPCYEGSSITAPKVSSSFSLDDEFRNTLFSMMQELRFALEGGHQMTLENKDGATEVFSAEQDKANKTVELENQNITEGNSDQTSFAASEDKKKEEEEQKKESENTSKESAPEKTDEEDEKKKNTNFAKEEDDKKKKEEDTKPSVDDDDDPDDKDDKDDDDDDKKKKSNFALETELEELKTKYSKLEADYNALVSFKNQIENEKKDELIKSFYMLSDEDKADVIANKANYSLDDIESKLSVICVRKKVNFTVEEEPKADDPITTFSLDGATSSNVPDWIKAVRRTAQDRH